MNKSLLISLICAVLLSGNALAQERLYQNTFPLCDVTLLDGPFKHARDLNVQVLLKYEVDRLLAPYRKETGLTPKGASFANWDGLDGHIAGHYLSAMAMNYTATHNRDCGQRLEYMLSELKACRDANAMHNPDWGSGYVGGVPGSKAVWSTLRSGDLTAYRAAWVPWYNLHKMYAGLRDAWNYTGNEDARSLFLGFCDWAISITSSLSDAQMQSMLDTEHGGMAEIFADAYQMTGDAKFLTAAMRFSHRIMFDAMAAGNDNLDNKHANTQIPKITGFERIGELTHDDTYVRAGRFFWEDVTANRTLAFGGNSRREHFPSISACDDYINDVEGPESCNSYNMLKLTEDLFRIDPSARYVDYYERTLYNHILSTQHAVHGGYVYFTPARPRHYRVYSAPNEAMWCCVGSGMENHGKYNQFIYTHRRDSLFVSLFIASELNWRERGVQIRQETTFPFEECTRIIVTKGSARLTLMIRYPSWVKDGTLRILVDGKSEPIVSHPSSYVALDRVWKTGDTVLVALPMRTTIEHLPYRPAYIAFMHGPILLGAKTGEEDLAGLVADGSRWGHIASGKRLPVDKAPVIIQDDPFRITDELAPVQGSPLTFAAPGLRMVNPINVVFEPFYRIHDARYMMYWMALTSTQYRLYLDSIAAVEEQKLELQQRTVDFVAAGEQQPEADHAMQISQSHSGTNLDEFWRDASDGGYFSYNLATNGEADLSLRVRYWGYEWGSRKFDIFLDDVRLLAEDNTGRWYQSKFQDVEYEIPNPMVKGKDHVRVKFQALPGNTAGAVYYLRLVKTRGTR
ncbi:MAG: glycoside hydrolase family 127 protein [Ignavibacteria bacterium]|nr:glycoside hydrolase family 127 protein [Ignavibacteria bacterium]